VHHLAQGRAASGLTRACHGRDLAVAEALLNQTPVEWARHMGPASSSKDTCTHGVRILIGVSRDEASSDQDAWQINAYCLSSDLRDLAPTAIANGTSNAASRSPAGGFRTSMSSIRRVGSRRRHTAAIWPASSSSARSSSMRRT
jgi:hypothetical protein